jgi:phosphoribosylaminoimidazole carboxylase
VGINNSVNVALLAARIIGVFDAEVQKKVENYAANAARENLGLKGVKLKELGWDIYLQEIEKR